jgi:hypothetical protein
MPLNNWYVNDNAQPNGDHEVHQDGCHWLAQARSKSYLGLYDNCREPVIKARVYHYSQSNGCAFCAPYCHTS